MTRYRVKTAYLDRVVGDQIESEGLISCDKVALQAGFLEEVKNESSVLDDLEALIYKAYYHHSAHINSREVAKSLLTYLRSRMPKYIPTNGQRGIEYNDAIRDVLREVFGEQ